MKPAGLARVTDDLSVTESVHTTLKQLAVASEERPRLEWLGPFHRCEDWQPRRLGLDLEQNVMASNGPVVHRERGSFFDLLDWPDVDALIFGQLLRPAHFRLAKDGETVEPTRYLRPLARSAANSAGIDHQVHLLVDGAPDPRAVRDLYFAGATIILQGVQRYRRAVGLLCRQLAWVMRGSCHANVYATRAGGHQGFDLHRDPHDVVVVQLRGSKQWSVPSMGSSVIDLAEGDVLFLPRNTEHAARTTTNDSLHLTVGVRVEQEEDLLRNAVVDTIKNLRGVLQRTNAATSDASFERYLGETAALVVSLDAPTLSALTTAGMFMSARPYLETSLTDREPGQELSQQSVLTRALPVPLPLFEFDSTAALLISDMGGLVLQSRPAVAACRELCTQVEPFTLTELPGIGFEAAARVARVLCSLGVLRRPA
ncbi:MAG TPA: cupin domain-containing protein [Mycobacteriales bacterium]|nr:cupin domain-containing protein [Mycobacteriales bacterium]